MKNITKKTVLCILIFEVVVALIYASMQKGQNDVVYSVGEIGDDLHQINELSMNRGVYAVSVFYNTASNEGYGIATASIDDSTLTHACDSNVVLLPYYKNVVEYPIYVNSENVVINLSYTSVSEDNPLQVILINVHRKAAASIFYIFWNTIWRLIYISLVVFVFYYIIYVRQKGQKLKKYKKVFLLGIIFLLVNLPLYMDYIPSGIDLQIHLNRIEGMADGLKSGVFPVRMHKEMWNGYGYPFGVFYGDFFYYIPAVLYLLGLPLWRAYRTFLYLVNAVTILVSYYSFNKICKNISSEETITNRYGGIFGCTIYTLGIWHLTVLYGRAAVGAYTAYIFLPLIVLGFWMLFAGNAKDKDNVYCTFISLTIGFSGIAVSHMLTLVIIGMFSIILCICCIRKLIEDSCIRLKILVEAAMSTLLISVGFLLPVFYMTRRHDLYISNFGFHIQRYGVYLTQLFMTDYNVTGLATAIPGVADDWPQTMGLALIIVFFVALWVVFVKAIDDSSTKAYGVCLAMSLLSVYMASPAFPYDWLQEKVRFVYNILVRVQTTNRFLLASVIVLSLLSIVNLSNIEQCNRKYAQAYLVIVLFITVCQGMSYISQYTYKASMVDALSNDDAGVLSYSDDYLYLFNDVDYEYVYQNYNVECSEDVEIYNENRNGYQYILEIANLSNETQAISLPIYNYCGYQLLLENGDELSIYDGENRRISADVPAQYTGKITLKYKEPVIWRVAEVISLVSLLLLGMYIYYNEKKKRC